MIHLAALAMQRTTIAEQNPWGGNWPRLKSHPTAHQAPRLLARLLADIMVSNSTTEVEMPNGIATPQGHQKYGQNFGNL